MPRFKHHRRARGIKPSVLQSAIITPAPVNKEFVVDVLADNHVNRMDMIILITLSHNYGKEFKLTNCGFLSKLPNDVETSAASKTFDSDDM